MHMTDLSTWQHSHDLNAEIRLAIEGDGDSVIADLHIWQVGVNKFAAIISVVAHAPQPPAAYKALLKEHAELVHLTVEVQRCDAEQTKEPSMQAA
jgi:Co/Zn/Cd efflux system component